MKEMRKRTKTAVLRELIAQVETSERVLRDAQNAVGEERTRLWGVQRELERLLKVAEVRR